MSPRSTCCGSWTSSSTATGDHDGVEAGRWALEAIDRAADLGIVGARVRPNLARAYLLVDAPDQAETVLAASPGDDEATRLLRAPAIAGRIALRRGHLGEADRQATRALAAASALDMTSNIGALDAYLARAGVLTDRNQLADASAVFERFADIARHRPEAVVYHILGHVGQVRVAAGSGDLDEAFALIGQARHLLDGRSHPALQQLVDTAEARWRIEAAQTARAAELIDGLRPDSPARALLAARLDLACGRPDAATARLAATGFATVRDRITRQLILARAAIDSGQPGEQLLADAVQLAVSEGFVQAFLDEGPIVTRLARAAAEALNTPAGNDLAVALGAPPPPLPGASPAVILSEREREILRYLPSRLTNQEISGECLVSVNTVKGHLKSIYAKLGVSSRSGAIERARLLGLL